MFVAALQRFYIERLRHLCECKCKGELFVCNVCLELWLTVIDAAAICDIAVDAVSVVPSGRQRRVRSDEQGVHTAGRRRRAGRLSPAVSAATHADARANAESDARAHAAAGGRAAYALAHAAADAGAAHAAARDADAAQQRCGQRQRQWQQRGEREHGRHGWSRRRDGRRTGCGQRGRERRGRQCGERRRRCGRGRQFDYLHCGGRRGRLLLSDSAGQRVCGALAQRQRRQAEPRVAVRGRRGRLFGRRQCGQRVSRRRRRAAGSEEGRRRHLPVADRNLARQSASHVRRRHWSRQSNIWRCASNGNQFEFVEPRFVLFSLVGNFFFFFCTQQEPSKQGTYLSPTSGVIYSALNWFVTVKKMKQKIEETENWKNRKLKKQKIEETKCDHNFICISSKCEHTISFCIFFNFVFCCCNLMERKVFKLGHYCRNSYVHASLCEIEDPLEAGTRFHKRHNEMHRKYFVWLKQLGCLVYLKKLDCRQQFHSFPLAHCAVRLVNLPSTFEIECCCLSDVVWRQTWTQPRHHRQVLQPQRWHQMPILHKKKNVNVYKVNK